jgi:hypothetical protein
MRNKDAKSKNKGTDAHSQVPRNRHGGDVESKALDGEPMAETVSSAREKDKSTDYQYGIRRPTR